MDPNLSKSAGTPPPLPSHATDSASQPSPKPASEPAHPGADHLESPKSAPTTPVHMESKATEVPIKHEPAPMHVALAEQNAPVMEQKESLDKPAPAPVEPSAKTDAPVSHADITPPPTTPPEVHPPHPANMDAVTPVPKPAVEPLKVPPAVPLSEPKPEMPMEPHPGEQAMESPQNDAPVSTPPPPAATPAPAAPVSQPVEAHLEEGPQPKSHTAMIALLVVSILTFIIGLFLFLSVRCIGPDLGSLFPAFGCESSKTVSPEDQGLVLPSADLSSPESTTESTDDITQ